ncbi:uncharacterized protein LOC127121716 [Lathyrus oleraceus]|uniref:uncharacterized protein LOC127121716 n=1 Tax=Pisum sativum TaxID=3888 RepID=UPI0021D20326|nr:uncharacterized protein LOC127121716 [Pisum sativum]
MQQLLKLLDDNSYVSRYRMCEDEITVRDIFWSYPNSINLFNMFPTVFILDSTHKTNNYRLLLLKIVGVTSIKKTYFAGYHITKNVRKSPPPPPKITFIDKVQFFMHKYIKQIVNVEGDDNCGYRAILALLGKGEDRHTLVRHQLIQELKTHKESYPWLYKKKENSGNVYESLVPCLRGPTPEEKWMHFSDMGHLIACAHDRLCINLTQYYFLETFFLMCTASSQNPNDRIMCIG